MCLLKRGQSHVLLKCNVNPCKEAFRGKHRWGSDIDSWLEEKEKGPEGGKNLENGPYSSLQTKGISEAADLFTAALIWPQDKIKAIRQIKSSQDKALKQIVKGTKKLDLQKLMLLDQHNLDIYHQGHSQIARLHPLPGSRGSFAEQVPSPQFAHIK